MKPRAHRVYTFSRLFSDFQNSLALRNTTESSLTKGRSCFALRLIGQDKEMSVFFPHLSKTEHVRQTKNIREIHAFHASLPPARPSTDDSQDVRTLVHLTTPAPIPCPACIWVKAESVPRMFFATSNPCYTAGFFNFQHTSAYSDKIKESQISLALQVYVRKHIPQFIFRLYHLRSSFSRPYIRFFNKTLQDRHSLH